MTQTTPTAAYRVFLSDASGLQIVGFGADRNAAVRDGLDRLQKIVDDRYDYSEFRAFGIFPAWQLNPHAFLAVENNSSEIDQDGYGEEFHFENHPDSEAFVVLIDSMSGRKTAW